MPLMGSLYIGNSGLATSQNALNTTAHNISNADTTGYVRQQILLGTNIYNTINTNKNAVSSQQIGLGVVYSRTRQVRDYFLDQTYRKESGRSAFYEVSSDALGEIENLLDEMNGESFEDSIANLWVSVQELAKDPSSAVTQGLFIERCSEFLARGKSVYKGLCDYQSNMNLAIKQKVDMINDYANKIKALNDEIVNIETGGVESANDLRDTRNFLVDELAKMGNIDYEEGIDGAITIKFESEDLVKSDVVYKIELDVDNTTGFYTPFWSQNAVVIGKDAFGNNLYDKSSIENATVFNLERVISSDLNTDVGSLKATLLARGDHQANFTDLSTDGRYNRTISQSVIMNVMAEFDQLVHGIATAVNQVIYDNADPARGYFCDEKGQPIQVFQKIASQAYTSVIVNGKPLQEEEKIGIYDEKTGKVVGQVAESLYSTNNLIVNQALIQQPTKLGFVRPDHTVDFVAATALKEAFTKEETTLNPNVKKKSSFNDYYSDLVSQVANSGSVYKKMVANQQETVDMTFSAREQVIGVSQDEEMTNMIKYQNAYNAASRYINVIDEMLEHIINTFTA